MALSPQQLCWSHRYGRTARSRPCQDFPWAPKPGFSSVVGKWFNAEASVSRQAMTSTCFSHYPCSSDTRKRPACAVVSERNESRPQVSCDSDTTKKDRSKSPAGNVSGRVSLGFPWLFHGFSMAFPATNQASGVLNNSGSILFGSSEH